MSLVLAADEGARNDLEEEEEERMVGSVTWRLYWQYFRSAFPAVLLLCLFFLVLFVQGMVTFLLQKISPICTVYHAN